MSRIKAVGVKELKNRLSAYLREVREGTVILVTDRENVVAELREPTVGRPPEAGNALEQEWIRDGSLHSAAGRKKTIAHIALATAARHRSAAAGRGARRLSTLYLETSAVAEWLLRSSGQRSGFWRRSMLL